MVKKIILSAVILFPFIITGQHTFSIVAVDTATGQVGAAGASCIDINNSYNINRINELVPGRGAINAQANWDFTNLANAKQRMERGDTPEEIIEWLKNNDSQGRPQRMQYVIADISGSNEPRAAAYTGSSAMDWAGHQVGDNYATAGNILIGARPVDSIESKFQQATGTLAERLMAALQGANFAGADKRCESEGVSSRSAFIRVALPTDPDGEYYCDLDVPETPYGVEPIDELQELFDEWNDTATGLIKGYQIESIDCLLHHNKNSGIISITLNNIKPDNIEVINFLGKKLMTKTGIQQQNVSLDLKRFGNGIYFINFYKNRIKLGANKVSLVK
jgi:uncharacterized Ntn-hydrolase superfamily protein